MKTTDSTFIRSFAGTCCAACGLALATAAGADVCGEFNPVSFTHPGGVDTRLQGVVALSAHDAWAVGQATHNLPGTTEKYTLTMHWDGSDWSVIPSPSPGLDYDGGTQCYLNDVAAFGSDDVWAVGEFKTVNPQGSHVGWQPLMLHWDGSDWEQVDAPFTRPHTSGAFVYGVAAIAPDDIWAGGLWPGLVDGVAGPVGLLLHWDGSDWTAMDAPYVSGDGHVIRGMDATSSDDVWAVGSSGNASRYPYVIHYDGSSWSHVDVPVPDYQHRLHDVAALAPDDVWIVGEAWDVDESYHPFILHYDGSSWTEVPSPGGGRSIAAIAPDNIWSADEWTTGKSIVHWDGSEWTVADTVTGANGATLLDLAAVGACDVWGVGRRPSFYPIIERLQGDASIPGDLDGDGDVDQGDLGILLSCYGVSDCGDLDGDGDTDQADLGALLGNYGV